MVVCPLALSCRPQQRPRPEHAVVGPKLSLRGFEAVRDTDVLKASLADDTGGYSSGYRTRNVLFVDATGKAWWLLPDDDHVLEEHVVRKPGASGYDPESPALAVLALARPIADDVAKVGDLYLFDPSGRRIQRIAEQVNDVHGAAMAPTGIAILYERGGGYFLEHYDPSSHAKVSAVPVDVPKLN